MNKLKLTLLTALFATPAHGMLCQLATTTPKSIGILKFTTTALRLQHEEQKDQSEIAKLKADLEKIEHSKCALFCNVPCYLFPLVDPENIIIWMLLSDDCKDCPEKIKEQLKKQIAKLETQQKQLPQDTSSSETSDK